MLGNSNKGYKLGLTTREQPDHKGRGSRPAPPIEQTTDSFTGDELNKETVLPTALPLLRLAQRTLERLKE